ncbi:substrate-binding domain-containing protein [Ruegeria sp. 6PALISEP08]|uniref:substrate-binding domain-containing protein n=1 Tax=Ruegeria sp. 6PALISEP08 TaxID=1225660 RepID=UPI00067EEC0E|nr:substrate-binding domain-containing protein [Ruegeria sp. 6PALISEP08]
MSSELRVFVPTAIRAFIKGIIPRMEAAAGASVIQLVDLNPAIPVRIEQGEAYDVGLTNPYYLAALIESGHADSDSHRPFGRVPLAFGRKEGAVRSVKENVNEINELLCEAESIAYTGAGTSGRTYLQVVRQLRLGSVVLPRSRAMGGGEPVASVVAGETELAVAPLTTILATPGIAPAAVLPEELKAHIDMSVFLSATPQSGSETALAFLTACELDGELATAGISRFEFG